MSKAKFEVYIVGDGKKPDWLIAETNGGRIKMVFEDDELSGGGLPLAAPRDESSQKPV